MQVCPKCGAEIKYIATGYGEIATCEAGQKFKGYPLHICKTDNNNEQKDNTNN